MAMRGEKDVSGRRSIARQTAPECAGGAPRRTAAKAEVTGKRGGAFRKKTLADKKPRYVKGGRDISEDEAMSRPKGEAKRKCQSKVDSYVTCPNCQTVVRIGRTADE